MTNYEKYKDMFIDQLSENKKLINQKPCLGCPKFINPHNKKVCEQCERLNKQWLSMRKLSSNHLNSGKTEEV